MFRKIPFFMLFLLFIIFLPCAGQKPVPIAPAEQDRCPVCTDLFGKVNYEGCMIKGNISSKGDRIYHCPLWRDYDKTVITEEKGERWFCTEEEAVAAGWRKPKYKTGSCRLLPKN